MAVKAGIDLVIGLVDQASSGLEKITGGVKGLGLIAGGVAVAGLVALGKASWDAGQVFDGVMDGFVAKTGASGSALDQLGSDFKAVFTAIPVDAQTAGDAMAALSQKTGMTGTALQDASKQVLEMSRLLGGDATANASDFGRVMGDWGLTADQAGGALDKIFVATQKSGIGVDALMQKVVQFGSPMRLMGFTLDESVALLAKFEKEGVNTELVMGSLRIAAGKFAKASEGTTTAVKGGVPSLKAAADQLAKLKDQLYLAQMRQGEFTKTTKASVEAASGMGIKNLTKDILDLEAAMALGEDRTVKTAGSNKTLRDSLLATFDAIKGNTNASAALAQGMDVFGAKAGPDMVAAIREGRFSIDELTAAMESADGAILSTAAKTNDFGEVWLIFRNKATTALEPLGTKMLEVATIAATQLGPAFDWLSTNGSQALAFLKNKFIEYWPIISGAVVTAWGIIQPKLSDEWTWLNTNVPNAITFLKNKFIEYWPIISGAVVTAWGIIQPKALELINYFEMFIPTAIATLKGIWDQQLLPAFRNLWDSLANPTTGIIPAGKLLVDWLRVQIPAAFVPSNNAFGIGALAITEFHGSLTDLVTPVRDFLRMLDDIARFLDGVQSRANAAGLAINNFLHSLDRLAPKGFSIPGFAGGTSFAPGGMAMVGENGPELVNLPRGSRVYSNSETQRMAGGDTLIFQFAGPASAYDERIIEAAVQRALANAGRRADTMQRTR
jgi:phage-related minor tail protein